MKHPHLDEKYRKKTKINLAGIEHDSVVNGLGVRTVFYTQGCHHHCKGCHNPQTWDFNGGRLYSYREVIDEACKNKLGKNVTFSGGDPVYQCSSLYAISQGLKELGFNIWVYTGFTFEYLLKFEPLVLAYTDVLVDGLFEIEKRTLDLPFRGSSNQRLINVASSLKSGKAVELEVV